MFAFLSAPIDTPPALGSLGDNQLCGTGINWEGKGTYTADGITKLCEALKGNVVTTLECAHAPRVLAFLSMPIDTPPILGSLAGNELCGLDSDGRGTYTAEGIIKLCDGLKGSSVTSLECAAAQ